MSPECTSHGQLVCDDWFRRIWHIPAVNPVEGNLSPDGGSNLNGLPSAPINESVIGLKLSLPENAMAVTISGEARKFIVCLLASLRPLKLRLKDVRMAEGRLEFQYR